MIILGVETSCDETSAAVVENGTKILSSAIASSFKLHIKTGGIIPEQAARAQIKSIIPVIQQVLAEAFSGNQGRANKNPLNSLKLVDAIAVTYGPGLIGSLLVGVETSKVLSFYSNKPLIPVNHLVAHIYASFLSSIDHNEHKTFKFPVLSLVVSGGHTDLVLIKKHGVIKWIGGTRDDAAGEAFDKCARILGLPYPGGPSISFEANKYLKNKPPKKILNLFPRPMINSNDYDFSFSGLKTAVLNYSKTNKVSKNRTIIASEIQEAVVDTLISKVLKAIDYYNPKTLVVSGGVAANTRLRQKIYKAVKNKKTLEFHVPPPSFCTDNAAMIASAAYYNYKPFSWKKVFANPQLNITGEY